MRIRSLVSLTFCLLALAACQNQTQNQGSAPQNACVNLAPNERSMVRTQITGLSTQYELRRLEDDTLGPRYEASIALEFREKTPATQAGQAQRMRERTNRCFAAMSEMMVGEKGERLSFRLVPASETLAAKLVTVTDEASLDYNSTLWFSTWGCPQIAHEIGHLIGALVDEYTRAEAGNKFACRNSGTPDSLMVDPPKAFEQATNHFERTDCACPIGNTACVAELEAMKLKGGNIVACPKSAIETMDKKYAAWEIHTDPNVAKEEAVFLASAAPGHFRFVKNIDSALPSLLTPSQMRVILYPGCSDRNGIYYSCAASAYKHAANNTCGKMPPECSNGSTSWLFDEGAGSFPVAASPATSPQPPGKI